MHLFTEAVPAKEKAEFDVPLMLYVGKTSSYTEDAISEHSEPLRTLLVGTHHFREFPIFSSGPKGRQKLDPLTPSHQLLQAF